MRYWERLEDARNVRARTNRVLDGHDIAPTPENYELLFHYELGQDKELQQTLATALKDGTATSRETLAGLHAKFLRPWNDEGLGEAAALLEKQLRQFTSTLETSGQGSSAYGNALDAVSKQLTGVDVAPHLRSIIDGVVSATRLMSEQNRELKAQVEGATAEVATLRSGMESIRKEAFIDALTGLANRRAFDEALAAAVRDARSEGTPLCVLMCDIDFFKKFNDTWGHATGDQVLKLVAHCVSSNVKGRDTAARYGGEELVVILPKTPLADAMIVAEQIRRTVESRRIVKKSTGESYGSITLSIGGSELRPGENAEEFLSRADQCLYAAKHAGRNRVCSVLPSGAEASVAKTQKAGSDTTSGGSVMELEFPDGLTSICVDPEVTLHDLRLRQLHQWWMLKAKDGLPTWRAAYLDDVSFVRDAYHLYEVADQGSRCCARAVSPALVSVVGEDVTGRWIDAPVAPKEKLSPTLIRSVEIVRLTVQMKSALRSFSKEAYVFGANRFKAESLCLPFAQPGSDINFVLVASVLRSVAEESTEASPRASRDMRAS